MSNPFMTQRRRHRIRKQLVDGAISAPEIPPLVRLWALRMLVRSGGYHQFIHETGFMSDSLAVSLGLAAWVDFSCHDFDKKLVIAELREQLEIAELEDADAAFPMPLHDNLGRLRGLLELDETDQILLGFATLLHSSALLDGAADCLGAMEQGKTLYVLATTIGIPEELLRKALHPRSVLAQSGLLVFKNGKGEYLSGKLELLNHDFAGRMTEADSDPFLLLQGSVSAVPAGTLHLPDFRHIQPSLDILLPYLQRALEANRKGVNILIHGAPGTGKSELTRTVATELGCAMFEISTEDEDGDPIRGEKRLRAHRAAQRFFAKTTALIVFDECEDVFNDGDFIFASRSTAQLRKGWVNRTLEQNVVPVFWLSNNIQGIDPAFLRRFDMIVELPVPPRSQRKRIVQNYCGEIVDASSCARIAGSESLAPAVLARASGVVHTIRGQLSPHQATQALERLISSTLQAQGHRPLLADDPTRLPEHYDPTLIHSDVDLSAIARGLVRTRSGRLCLYGPPGTGKSAYGRWLAEQLDMPLVLKRGSDLISKWVGETEANIARAFQQATMENAVLIIDEVDGFLQDRRAATNSWERTQVNELLTQMEAFPGLFIASTNLMDGLDQAALRRFDLKVKFDYLHPPQAFDLLQRHCTTLGIAPPDAEGKRRLARLSSLTPGDFAVAQRQHRFRPITSASMLIALLEAECSLKDGAKRAIGFR